MYPRGSHCLFTPFPSSVSISIFPYSCICFYPFCLSLLRPTLASKEDTTSRRSSSSSLFGSFVQASSPRFPPSPAQAFILLCRPTPVSHVDLTDKLLQCGSSPAKQAQPNKGLFTAESTCQQEGRGRKPAPSLRQGSSQLSTSLLSWSTPVISDSTIGCRMFIISNQQ